MLMKDFDKFKKRFVQFGGWRLILQYARMGVLWTGVKALLRCALKGRSMKEAYPAITGKVDEKLVKRYRHILDNNKMIYKEERFIEDGQETCAEGGIPQVESVPKIIWFSWLQGIDNAPEIVKACLTSQRKHLVGYEFRIFDLDNYRQWVELPETVVRKYREGKIPQASFSDLLRLSVLRKYGGVWMDASVYCSGFGNENLQQRWNRIMTSELTVFRYFERGSKIPVGLSTWFFAAVPNQIVVSTVLDMLLAYWNDFDCLVDYYIIHLFLGLALSEFPQFMARMPYENSNHSLLLGDALSRTYSQEAWQELVDHVAIHKLNYRKAEEAQKNPQSYYNFILEINQNDIQT